MVSRKKKFEDGMPTSVLLPVALQRAIAARADAEDRSFTAVVRRALKKELGFPMEEDSDPDRKAA